ncbi:hypothetical protein OAA34_00315 [bacterium]|nr:hypothetical protein [bacterium]
MPTQVKFRRGTTSQNNSFTGAAGEISLDTDKDTIRVHDGSTAGGFELLRADLDNVDSSALNTKIDTEIDAYLSTIFADAALTGTPTAPTASTGTNTTQIATTEFVQQEIQALKDTLYAYG